MTDRPYTHSPGLADPLPGELAGQDAETRNQQPDQSAQSVADQLGDKASELADQAKRDYVEPAIQRAQEALEQQKRAGADRISGVARAAHTAADQLGHDMPLAAQYVHQAAGGIERVSNALRNRSADELTAAIGNFARNQPAAFFGATIVAGFALSRFLKSTAAARSKAVSTQQPASDVRR